MATTKTTKAAAGKQAKGTTGEKTKTTATTEAKPRGRAKPKAGDALGLTLGELAELHLLHLEQIGKSRGTVFSYSIDLAVAVRELGKETRIKSIKPEAVAAFFESDAVTRTRSGKEKARATIDKTRRVLRLALVWAAETGEIPVAPLPAGTVDGRKARARKESDEKAAKKAKRRRAPKPAAAETSHRAGDLPT